MCSSRKPWVLRRKGLAVILSVPRVEFRSFSFMQEGAYSLHVMSSL